MTGIPDARRKKTAPKCFFCVDVLSGTLGLSIAQIIMHLTLLSLLLVIYLNPSYMHRFSRHLFGAPPSSMHDRDNSMPDFHSGPMQAIDFVPSKHMLMSDTKDEIDNDDFFGRHHHHHHHPHPHPHPPHPTHHPHPTGQPGEEMKVNIMIEKPLDKAEQLSADIPIQGHLMNWMTIEEERTILVDKKQPGNIFISRVFSLVPSNNNNNGEINNEKSAIAGSDDEKNMPMDNELNGFDKMSEHHHHHHPPHHHFKRCSGIRHTIGLALIWFSLAASFLLCYGVLAKRPIFVLLYVTLQVIDLAFVCVTFSSFISYLPHVKIWLSQQPHIPFKHHMLQMNNSALNLLLFSIGLMILAGKLYLIGMVWSCYRFIHTQLRLQRLAASRRLPIPDTLVILDSELLIPEKEKDLPVYEQCLKMPLDSYMPPSYNDQDAEMLNVAVDEKEKDDQLPKSVV